MNKVITLMIALTVIVASMPAEAGLGVKLKGGYTYISYGDYNDWADEVNKAIPSEYPTYDNINWIPEVSAEFTFPIFPAFSGGVGVGYLSGKSDYNATIGTVSVSEVHKVKAIPVLMNVYWEPSLQSIKPFVYGGIGFYRTSLEFASSFSQGGQIDGYTADMEKWGFGLQGGGGISLSLAPKVSFDVGIQGRWAEISGFEGTATRLNGDQKEVYLGKGWEEVDGVDVYYYGPISKDETMEEASVNLSGYTIFIGLTIGF